MLLQYALEKEQSEIGAEKAKKQGEKEQAQKYRAFLEEQMIKEACDNTGIEEYRRVESEKIWVKRDNDKKAQDDARSHLMKEVKEGRVEQIRLKELKKEDDRKYFLEQMSLDKMEWDRQENALQEKAAGVKAGIQQNMTALKNQIALRKANIAKEEQEKYLLTRQMERQQDLMLLQYALEKEQSEIGAEKAKKQGEKEQAQKYRAFLEEQMIKEACDNTGIEEYRRVESEKIWVKRDNDKKAQDDARSHLMKEVKEGRVEQIRLKELKKEDDRKYFLEQMSLDKMEWDRQENALQEKAAGVKAGIQQNMTALKNQIALRKANIAKEEQEKYLLTRQMEHMELSHQNRLKEQAGVVRSYYPKGHTQWFT